MFQRQQRQPATLSSRTGDSSEPIFSALSPTRKVSVLGIAPVPSIMTEQAEQPPSPVLKSFNRTDERRPIDNRDVALSHHAQIRWRRRLWSGFNEGGRH